MGSWAPTQSTARAAVPGAARPAAVLPTAPKLAVTKLGGTGTWQRQEPQIPTSRGGAASARCSTCRATYPLEPRRHGGWRRVRGGGVLEPTSHSVGGVTNIDSSQLKCNSLLFRTCPVCVRGREASHSPLRSRGRHLCYGGNARKTSIRNIESVLLLVGRTDRRVAAAGAAGHHGARAAISLRRDRPRRAGRVQPYDKCMPDTGILGPAIRVRDDLDEQVERGGDGRGGGG